MSPARTSKRAPGKRRQRNQRPARHRPPNRPPTGIVAQASPFTVQEKFRFGPVFAEVRIADFPRLSVVSGLFRLCRDVQRTSRQKILLAAMKRPSILLTAGSSDCRRPTRRLPFAVSRVRSQIAARWLPTPLLQPAGGGRPQCRPERPGVPTACRMHERAPDQPEYAR